MGHRGAFRRFHVEDWSMAPTFIPGDHLRVDARAYEDRVPVPGELVVIQDPESDGRRLLKRVERVVWEGPDGIPFPDGKPRLFVVGDNALRSRDSRQFGPVAMDRVVGRVTSPGAPTSPLP